MKQEEIIKLLELYHKHKLYKSINVEDFLRLCDVNNPVVIKSVGDNLTPTEIKE